MDATQAEAKKKVAEALGLTEERLDELSKLIHEKCSKLTRKGNSPLKIVQSIYEDASMTRVEIAYVAYRTAEVFWRSRRDADTLLAGLLGRSMNE